MTGPRRRSSAPSRAIRREDDEGDVQHGGNASKPYRGLSDEIIFNIYDEFFAAKPEKKDPPRGLNQILVSKRIYNVARPAWLHSYKISSSASRGDRFIAGLLDDETACVAVHALDFKVFASHEHTTAAMLRRLPYLQYLRLSFDAKEQGRSTNDPLPSTLGTFDKAAGPSSPKKVLDLIDSQLLTCPGPLPLCTVIIDLLGKAVNFATIINTTLSIFAPHGATIFRFSTAGAADFRPMSSFGGAVQDLSISSHIPYNLTEGRNFANLIGFIKQMSSLHRFRFYGLAVDGSDFDLDLDGLDQAELKVEYPMLFALLSCLTEAPVTTLIIASKVRKTSTRYKWKRSSHEEPFQLE